MIHCRKHLIYERLTAFSIEFRSKTKQIPVHKFENNAFYEIIPIKLYKETLLASVNKDYDKFSCDVNVKENRLFSFQRNMSIISLVYSPSHWQKRAKLRQNVPISMYSCRQMSGPNDQSQTFYLWFMTQWLDYFG